ncbi:MarR family winged helix-turn-helix transcriptional regulator [Geotoga petraea]|jgi:DNA-binding MarR family transcriptional regulator|uniref:DNA-binding transcriptional regulator, MarR family n=1 Tax=Geotoga petraea TaxID=28234 RepID=A0A1G6HS96_9BACT|nr:MarR family transcriptional regulator [Geotoga petraea]TGG88916.1 MarR family transcriptional regulator [Geotoga petraea]SDB96366.1 DNA-binding transcriptional regulator, MarR family [Geotoga petraea]
MEEQLKLENQLCFSLYTASRLITRLYQPHLKKIGLTYLQYIVMLVMWEKEKIVLKELGDTLYLDSGTLSPLIKKLEKKDLVKKQRSEKDERILEVEITQKGRELKEKAKNIPFKIAEETGLTMEQYHNIKKMTDEFIKNHV